MQSYSVLPSSASRHCLHAFCVTVDSLFDLPSFFFGFILIRLRLERYGALMCLVICTDIHINIHASKRLDRDTVEVKKGRCPIKQDASVRAPSFCPIISLFFSVFFFHSVFFFILFFPLPSRHVSLQEETFEGRSPSSTSGHLSPCCHPTASPA